MPLKVTAGNGFRGMEADLRLMQQEVQDPRPTLNSVVYPYMVAHIEEMFRTSGQGAWNFGGEPIYQRNKVARNGARLGAKPLLVDPAHALLLPSLTDPRAPFAIFRLERKRLVIGSSLDYAEDLLVNGGVGPYGEPFPARNPFLLTPQQQQELGDEIEFDLRRRLKRYFKTATLL